MIVWQGFSQSTSTDKVCFNSLEARKILNDLYKGEMCDSLLIVKNQQLEIANTKIANIEQIIQAREGQIKAINNLYKIAEDNHKTQLEIKQGHIKRLKRQKLAAYIASGFLASVLVLTNI